MPVTSVALDSAVVLGMSLRSHGSRPWSWDDVGLRTLAVYQSEHSGRLRTGLLLWQGDDPQVRVDGKTPALVAFTTDASVEPGPANAVALAGFDSLEAARSHCIESVGSATEADWAALGETAQIGIYAAIRDPSFADGG
jgi:hypothetical protein